MNNTDKNEVTAFNAVSNLCSALVEQGGSERVVRLLLALAVDVAKDGDIPPDFVVKMLGDAIEAAIEIPNDTVN